jgi:hypothetical protein
MQRIFDEKVETEVRNWLRQQSKDFCAADFEALGKRWDKCINVGGGYVEKGFFSSFEYHVLCFISVCDLLLTLPRTRKDLMLTYICEHLRPSRFL